MFSVKTKIFAVIFINISIFSLIFAYFSGIVTPIIYAKCEAVITNHVESIIAKTLSLSAPSDLFDDIINFTYNKDGSIAAFTADMAGRAKLRSLISKSITDSISDENKIDFNIKSGTLSGIPFLFDTGFNICISIDALSYAEFDVTSEFIDSGINQTLHKLSLKVETTSALKAPFMKDRITTETLIPLSETVLIGDVPEAYTVIIRAHEQDEEDINDYAAGIEN